MAKQILQETKTVERTYEEALAEARLRALISGGVTIIGEKALTSEDGYYYLDGELVKDPTTEIHPFIELDDEYVRSLMSETL